jgi:hypothetical protein
MRFPIHRYSLPADKIALCRSLFRGCEDVYARLFVSRKTGRVGYQPACANEWARDLCSKRTVRCAECPNRRFLPVTDEVIRWHMTDRDDTGRDFVASAYPMLLDETCCSLAVDLDQESWREDASAFLRTCSQLNLPAVLERSRSSNGGHVLSNGAWLYRP